jgi:hypothetical protein
MHCQRNVKISEEHTASIFKVTIRFMWMLKLWGMCRLYGRTEENLAHKSHGRKKKKALVSANMSEFHKRPFEKSTVVNVQWCAQKLKRRA